EGASFVRNDGHDELSYLWIAQQFRQQSDEDHSGGNFAAFSAFIKFFEMRFIDRFNRLGTNFTRWHVTAQLFAALLHVSNFSTVVRWTIKRCVMQIFVRNRNSKSRAEHAQLVLIELLLLVCDIFAFTRFAQSVTFNGFGEDDCRRPFVLHRRFVGGMHFDGIMAAKAHPRHLLVGKMFHHPEQTRISSEQVLPEVGPALYEKFLILAVGDFA